MAGLFVFNKAYQSHYQPFNNFPFKIPFTFKGGYLAGNEEIVWPTESQFIAPPWDFSSPDEKSCTSSEFSDIPLYTQIPNDQASPQTPELTSDTYLLQFQPQPQLSQQLYHQNTPLSNISTPILAHPPTPEARSLPSRVNPREQSTVSISSMRCSSASPFPPTSRHAQNHSSVEKRYRTNLNSSIDSLWQVLPPSSTIPIKDKPCRAAVISLARTKMVELERYNEELRGETERLRQRRKAYEELLAGQFNAQRRREVERIDRVF